MPNGSVIKKIAFCTTNFGFGPVSKTMYIARSIRERLPAGTRLIFVGSHESYSFAKKNDAFDGYEYIDTDKEISTGVRLLSDYDLIVNVMNFELVKNWPNVVPMVLVDSLTWMWTDKDCYADKITRYFVQDYLLDDRTREECCQNSKYQIIPPIGIPASASAREKDSKLMINFSGACNPYCGIDYYTNYAKVFIRLITTNMADMYKRLLFITNDSLKEMLLKSDLDVPSNAEIAFLSHDEFIDEARSSKKVLTTPGITTTIELIRLGVDFGFLLPQNYSQALMAEQYKQILSSLGVMALNDFGERFTVPKQINEDAGVDFVRNSVVEILKDLDGISRRLIDLIKHDVRAQIVHKTPSLDNDRLGQDFISDYVKERLYQQVSV